MSLRFLLLIEVGRFKGRARPVKAQMPISDKRRAERFHIRTAVPIGGLFGLRRLASWAISVSERIILMGARFKGTKKEILYSQRAHQRGGTRRWRWFKQRSCSLFLYSILVFHDLPGLNS